MMTDTKMKYIQQVNCCEGVSIYNQPFWLDAVCGEENWDAVLVEENGQIVAAVPYFKKKKYGIQYITQPPLTQHFDIWIKPCKSEKKEKKLEHEFDLLSKVAEQFLQLGYDYNLHVFSPNLTNWQPFHWNGFRQETRYTFLIPRGMQFADVQQQMSANLKRDIKKASQSAVIEEIEDVDLFYHYNSMSFSRQGKNNPVSKELVESVYAACKEHNACKMVAARDGKNIHCVGFYAFDEHYVYEIMLGTDPEKRGMNYKSYMTSEMICFACETGRGFDFEGSMIKSIANYNRRFGADMVPYFKVWKTNTQKGYKKLAIAIKNRGVF